eukprot:5832708-Amphidinium_carterae.1
MLSSCNTGCMLDGIFLGYLLELAGRFAQKHVELCCSAPAVVPPCRVSLADFVALITPFHRDDHVVRAFGIQRAFSIED